jgi:DNA polymerase type B, organellar and viral
VRAKLSRPRRLAIIAAKLAGRAERRRGKTGKGQRPFMRREWAGRARRMVAYDLETSRIAKGTPRVLYVTAHGESVRISEPVRSLDHFAEILVGRFLTDENAGVRFVGWNANSFDVYFVGLALLRAGDYILRPYLTRSRNLRGLRVQHRDSHKTWEFLDGLAMFGAAVKLDKFLALFAPELRKLGAPDWEREEFDARNPAHVAYAERDSEGLYHAINKADSLMREHFGIGLNPTVGNTGIKIFQSRIPESVQIWDAPNGALAALREQAIRGGYCVAMRRYEGPIWKYDLNQAYAAAMRDAALPAGRAYMMTGRSKYAKAALYRITATHSKNRVPFYWKDDDGKARFTHDAIGPTWLTSIEVDQLHAEKWRVEYDQTWAWDAVFSMKTLVDELEFLRFSDPAGPSGPLGTLAKNIGNNAFGKTLEHLDGMEIVLANECPENFTEYQPDDEQQRFVFCKLGEPTHRDYHKPQIGAWITAHVRMVVRRAALMAPDAFLYADTDCVVFSRPVDLPIDPRKYGLWKIEEAGALYRLITKKVYSDFAGKVKHAKGLIVGKLTAEDFKRWYDGEPPRQVQIQRVNWLKVMTGETMFLERVKMGEKKVTKPGTHKRAKTLD